MSHRPAAVALFAIVITAAATACSEEITCAGVQYIRPTLPDTTTIKVDAATIAIAGESFGSCGTPSSDAPPRQYVWHVSDSAVVAVAVIDSIHVRLVGLRVGRAIVTPAYRAGGDPLGSVTVTVVP